jgi:hypothetical protein
MSVNTNQTALNSTEDFFGEGGLAPGPGPQTAPLIIYQDLTPSVVEGFTVGTNYIFALIPIPATYTESNINFIFTATVGINSLDPDTEGDLIAELPVSVSYNDGTRTLSTLNSLYLSTAYGITNGIITTAPLIVNRGTGSGTITIQGIPYANQNFAGVPFVTNIRFIEISNSGTLVIG